MYYVTGPGRPTSRYLVANLASYTVQLVYNDIVGVATAALVENRISNKLPIFACQAFQTFDNVCSAPCILPGC